MQVPDTSNSSATQVRHERHECDTNDMIARRVKNVYFDSDASDNIFSFLKRFIFFFLNKFIILDFVNYPKKNTPWNKTMKGYQIDKALINDHLLVSKMS